MRKVVQVILLLAGVVQPTVTAVLAGEQTETAEFRVQRVKAWDGVGVLRAIIGVGGLEVVDERTIRMQGSPENSVLARRVVDMMDGVDAITDVTVHEVGDDTVLASVLLRHASIKDVMTALRAELQIKRLAAIQKPPLILVRDSPKQIEAALALISAMESR